jgi:hypothetical protein
MEIFTSTVNVSPGDIKITVNIHGYELRFLTEAVHGNQFYAKDEPALKDETVRANIQAVYSAVGISSPEQFTSCAARAAFNQADTCNAYGNVVLVLNQDRIKNDLVIFNGDVKDIGHKIKGESDPNSWIEVHTLTEPIDQLVSALNALTANARVRTNPPPRPRLIGGYFEARLTRALKPEDIEAVHVSSSDQEAIEQAEILRHLVS